MISIRSAKVQDIEAIKNIVRHSVLELCKNFYTPEQLQSLLKQYPGPAVYQKWIRERVLLVAELDGELVGFGQYFPDTFSIEAVHVLPGHVHQGIGKMIVEEIEAIAKTRGASNIMLGSSLNAVGFYEKCGYIRKAVSQYRCMDGNELDVVDFEKALKQDGID